MQRRLFWSIFGVSAAVLTLVVVLVVGGVNAARERATRAELERAATAVTELVGERLDQGLAPGEILRGETDLAGLNALRRVAGGSDLALFGITPQGEIVGRRIVRDLGLDTGALLAGEAVFSEISSPEGELLVHARPVGEIGPRDVTLAVLLARQTPVELRIPSGLILATFLLVASGAAIAARFLAAGITRRLDSVAAAARALSQGKLSARAEVAGDDELTTVAASFNDMATQLEESREREREFLLAVGHDLRTPLTTIAGYAEALEEGLDDPDEVARIAGVLGVESGRLRRLIEDVMLLARLESSDYTLRPEPVDVTAHVAGLVEPFADRAAQVSVRLVTDLAPVGERRIDPDRLGQILANLLENALRYTPAAGRVTVTVGGSEDSIELAVADTGPGIEPEDLPHIFDRFYVARRYRGVRPEGSGLGLSIVRQLSRAMGGDVEASSTVGEGTTIQVRLPAPPL